MYIYIYKYINIFWKKKKEKRNEDDGVSIFERTSASIERRLIGRSVTVMNYVRVCTRRVDGIALYYWNCMQGVKHTTRRKSADTFRRWLPIDKES